MGSVARKVVETPPTNNRPTWRAGHRRWPGVRGQRRRRELRAYDAKNGTQLWSYKAQTAVYAGPITTSSMASSTSRRAWAAWRRRLLRLATRACWCSRLRHGNVAGEPVAAAAESAAVHRVAEVIKAGEDKYNQYCSVPAPMAQQRGTFRT
jgi:hypothetical protein